jgi:two-component system, LytTR family, response regulator
MPAVSWPSAFNKRSTIIPSPLDRFTEIILFGGLEKEHMDLQNKKLRCVVIDPDVNELREFSRVVINNPRLELVNTCKTGRSAVNLLKEHKVDLIFINPALPDANGFDLMASLPDSPMVVIISDRMDYAYYAFRIDAVDYRIKPISPDLLNQMIDRVILRMMMKQALNESKSNTGDTKK